MSAPIPRHVASFNDQSWGSSGRSRFQEDGHANGGVAEKIGGMFSDRRPSLPMYKDKPYQYPGSHRKVPWFRRRRLLALLLVLFFAFLYFTGVLSSGDSGKSAEKPRKASWGLFGSDTKEINWDERRDRVRDAFKMSWSDYKENAWGFDEYHPVSKGSKQMVTNGMGWIIVDALDTLMLMNLTTEITDARDWVQTMLSYDVDHDVSTFETTIRMLGGLLSAYYLSAMGPTGGDDLYLEKATDLADRLLGAYDSKSGVPFASVNLHTMAGIPSKDDGGASSTAEATSVQLEMKYLAKLTGEVHYWEKAEKVMQVVDDNGERDGLLPIFIHADRGTFRGNNIRLGSRGDSYYEYLIKQYLQTSKQEPIYQEMWDQSLAGVQKHLITYSYPSNLTVLGERPSGLDKPISAKMDHLVCFMPGTIALGATEGKTVEEARKSPSWGTKQEKELELAKQLMKTCWGMYKVTATGLAPEIAHFNIHDPPVMMEDRVLTSPETLDPAGDAEWYQDYHIKGADVHNLQRPETVESLFYMWRITGDEMYRHWGWEMFQSFVKHTVTEDGKAFSSIGDVNRIPPPTRDNMESFWLAETLKYMYLLFGPNDVLPLDQVVFNTEAHAFPRFELGKLFRTGWERKPRDKDGKIIKSRTPTPPTPPKHDEPQVKIQTVTLAATEAAKLAEMKDEVNADAPTPVEIQG